ncbi:hypothetical protein ACLKA7_015481 [Drosophila subpalustris]
MKQLLPFCLFFAALAAASASASVLPGLRSHLPAANQPGELVWLDKMINPVPDKCDFSCTNQDLSVCAHNGQCLQLFTSRCTMAAYNCRNPQKRFNIVENYRCTQGHMPLCSTEERKELGITL